MDKPKLHILAPLPLSVVNQATSSEQREHYLLRYLQNVMPNCDIKDIEGELQKSFTLSKHKSKVKKKKTPKSPFLTVRKSILLGLNKYSKTNVKYSDMLSLHDLWLEYMHHMLGLNSLSKIPTKPTSSKWDTISQRLIKADYHGAKISVISSKCPSTVGIEGIVLQDTKNTFRILGIDNKIRTVPKESSVFQIKIENVCLEVYGKELCIKPAERSVKKIKNCHVSIL